MTIKQFTIITTIIVLSFAQSIFSQTTLLTPQDIKPSVFGNLFSPDKNGIYPGIIIMHGSSGLAHSFSEYHEFATHIADKGYCVLLIDLYAETGNAEAGSEKRFELWETWQKILINGVNFLKALPHVKGDNIAIIGFSRGAWITLTAISKLPNIKAIINYYGVGKQSLESTTHLPPTLMMYGTNDMYADSTFINTTYLLLKQKNKDVELILYPNANHGFNFYEDKKDNEVAAVDAFEKTCIFLEKNLKAFKDNSKVN